MSVLCQNFVQNAWKKDLCSNCFKSIGDHEFTEENDKNGNFSTNGEENDDTDDFCSSSVSQITWKSLITNKQGNNSQPFKLETGFHGRLLTINRANVFEKKSVKISAAINGSPAKKLNSKQVENEIEYSKTSESEYLNSKGNCVFEISTSSNKRCHVNGSEKVEIENGINDRKVRIGEKKGNANKFQPRFRKGVDNRNESKIVQNGGVAKKSIAPTIRENKKEIKDFENKEITELSKTNACHKPAGILKKNSSTNGNPIRRSSSVGFKEEEPAIIGYGGRDFSPEELEWEMTVSDGDGETASDCLDDTDDDQAFTKITKQNTEYNSETTNLLLVEQGYHNGTENEKSQKLTNNFEQENEIYLHGSDLSNEVQIDRQFSSGPRNESQNNCMKTSTTVVVQKSIESKNILATGNQLVEDLENENQTSVTKLNLRNSVPIYKSRNDVQTDSELNTHKENGSPSDCINFVSLPNKLNNDCQSLCQAELKKENVKVNGFSNISMTINETHATSSVSSEIIKTDCIDGESSVSKQHPIISPLRGDVTKAAENNQHDTIHFGASIGRKYGHGVVVENRNDSDGSYVGDVSREYDTTFDGQNCGIIDITSVANGLLKPKNVDQLHEAINLTLTSPRSMERFQLCNSESTAPEASENVTTPSKDACTEETTITAEEFQLAAALNHTVQQEAEITFKSMDPNEDEIQHSDGPCEVKPRVSFLHGSGSDNKDVEGPPSAVYAPGSDFFVSRRDSVSSLSSSSSTDQKKFYLATENEETEIIEESKEETCEKPDSIKNSEEISLSPVTVSTIISKVKPALPAKPCKPSIAYKSRPLEPGHYAKPISKTVTAIKTSNYHEKTEQDECVNQGAHYFVSTVDTNSVSVTNHYAEANVFHDDKETAIQFSEESAFKEERIRESKLAALAVELEQARQSCNLKRQAPAPPKIPELPQEEPPSCLNRVPSPLEVHSPMQVYKGDALPFSSASSTTSSSSQDDTGFGSWNLHGDIDDNNYRLKWKNSFLLAQYSKCKMLAKGYANNYGDTKSKSRKRFSLKKLLKLGKESDIVMAGENRCPNHPKAWKYSENFDRPRAKLEIIHPMDLKDKSLTVNPGFDSSRSRSTSSFSSGDGGGTGDMISIRNSRSSSECGSYYSDSINTSLPHQQIYKEDDEYALPSQCDPHENSFSGRDISCENIPNRSVSPTPSRCSANSQASTLTSGSSKNGCSVLTNRPPKPPPPPRAHSLLLDNKISDGTCKVSSTGDAHNNSSTSEPLERISPQPQAPKRLYRTGTKAECSNFDVKNCSSDESALQETWEEDERQSPDSEENPYECVHMKQDESDPQQYEDVELPLSIFAQNNSQTKEISTIQVKQESGEKEDINVPTFNKAKSNLPTRTPLRPPPIYSKLPFTCVPKENAWKTLESSYTALASNNRDILIKLIEQSIKERPALPMNKLQNLQWEDFILDNNQLEISSFGDKFVYDAFLASNRSCHVTLLLSLQHMQQQTGLSSSSHFKYPLLENFYGEIPSYLVQGDLEADSDLDTTTCAVYVLNRSHVTTVELFIQDVPDVLTEQLEKEICLILLQTIHELKALQAQGIEEIDPSFHNLLLAKTEKDIYYTVIFLSESFFEDGGNAFASMADDSKVSLCQYALMLIFQFFKVDSPEELNVISSLKFTRREVAKIFENVVSLLLEEKAVSLSQVKNLLECFMWGVQTLICKSEFDNKEADVMLYRWIHIERSIFIKNIISNASFCMDVYAELHSQFLIRPNIKNIKDIVAYL